MVYFEYSSTFYIFSNLYFYFRIFQNLLVDLIENIFLETVR